MVSKSSVYILIFPISFLTIHGKNKEPYENTNFSHLAIIFGIIILLQTMDVVTVIIVRIC